MSGPSFVKATREATRLRIGLESPSGAGKTWTALKLATALAEHDGGRIAVIDSERGSSSKYSGGRPYDFDMCVLEQRDPTAYIAAMRQAAANHYPVVVIDSGSHEWKGVLALVDSAASRMQNNTWAGWSRGRPAHDAFVEEMLALRAHVIVTFRAKQETEQYQDGGKTKVRKIGLAPVTSEDMDYEFDVWGSISHDEHTVIISKSRIDTIPVGSEWLGGEGLVAAYLAWVDGAEYAEPPAVPIHREPVAATPESNRRGTSRSQREPRPPVAPSAEPKFAWRDSLQRAMADHSVTGDDLERFLGDRPSAERIQQWLDENPAKNVIVLVQECALAKGEAADVVDGELVPPSEGPF